MKTVRWILVLLVLSLIISGCFIRSEVNENEVGLELGDGAQVSRTLSPGRHTNAGWYAQLVVIDVSAKTLTWEDPDLVTRDKQPIGLTLGVTYARDRTCIEEMYSDYNAEALDDAALETLVRTRIPRVAKNVTTQFSLDGMLGVEEGNAEANRTLVESRLSTLLAPELEEFCVVLRDVGINNISPSERYLSLIEEKSNAQVAVEVARERTRQLQEQLNQEEAQTEIELEQARRENLVNAELAKTYEASPEYYELERLRLLENVIGSNDKLIFVPQGSDITYFLSDQGLSAQPIPAAPAGGPEEGNR